MSDHLRTLLTAFQNGEIDQEEVLQRIVRQPYEEHLLGRFDHLRETRTGIPEVVLAEGKPPEEVADIFRRYRNEGRQLIATRVTDEVIDRLADSGAFYYIEEARVLAVRPPEVDRHRPTVMVIAAGTVDRPVATEAAVISRLLGNPTETLHDVGVSGLSRISTDLSRMDQAGVVIVVAGMDGALPSLVGSVARQPVIAVPTSQGYGASFEGLSPLLTMLNSCVPGTAVMNIDNGFGAAVHATKINQLVQRGSDHEHPDPNDE